MRRLLGLLGRHGPIRRLGPRTYQATCPSCGEPDAVLVQILPGADHASCSNGCAPHEIRAALNDVGKALDQDEDAAPPECRQLAFGLSSASDQEPDATRHATAPLSRSHDRRVSEEAQSVRESPPERLQHDTIARADSARQSGTRAAGEPFTAREGACPAQSSHLSSRAAWGDHAMTGLLDSKAPSAAAHRTTAEAGATAKTGPTATRSLRVKEERNDGARP